MDIKPAKKKTDISDEPARTGSSKKPNVVYVIGFILILLFALILAITKPDERANEIKVQSTPEVVPANATEVLP